MSVVSSTIAFLIKLFLFYFQGSDLSKLKESNFLWQSYRINKTRHISFHCHSTIDLKFRGWSAIFVYININLYIYKTLGDMGEQTENILIIYYCVKKNIYIYTIRISIRSPSKYRGTKEPIVSVAPNSLDVQDPISSAIFAK